jgi:hypothetical protein
MRLDHLTLEIARPLVGTRFELRSGGTTAVLTLTSASAFEVRQQRVGEGGKEARRPFALYFAGPRDPVLPQASYTLRGDGLELEGIFLVPVGRNDETIEYEAVFA